MMTPAKKTETDGDQSPWKVWAVKAVIQWPIVFLLAFLMYVQYTTNESERTNRHEIQLRHMDESLKLEKERLGAILAFVDAVNDLGDNSSALGRMLTVIEVSNARQSEEMLRAMAEQERSRQERAKSYEKVAAVLDSILNLLREQPRATEFMEVTTVAD